MMISEQQAKMAAHHLREAPTMMDSGLRCRVSNEIVSAALQAACDTPDLRMDRIEAAKSRLADSPPDARDIAEKIISRILGDSLR